MLSNISRFYSVVGVEPKCGSFVVTLDGKPIQTPKQAPFIVCNRALAAAVATEWDAQEERVVLACMPLTRLVASSIDHMPTCREQIIDEIASYVATDLVCYRADYPPELANRQEYIWKPLIDGFNRYFHVELCVSKGIQPIEQDPDSIVYVRRELTSQNDMELMGLHRVTTILGSVVIALAILREEIDVDAAWQASIVDESFQIERWGLDEEEKKRRDINYLDYNAAVKFMHLNRL